ncbi:MAG TPA: efflux RND transporter periplasmic adaptor subunit [Caulobacteraceae bacterium]|jgi:cobalt-zinc-cadmium efflux system membrane fusion protein|nr:efflux RND transporter periplasmic adaptor subunit [Caulobacteraceae bacterium]
MRTDPLVLRRPLVRAAAVLAGAALVALAGCSPRPQSEAPPSVTPTTVKLTPVQQQHIGSFTVTQSAFGRTIDAPGVVDFDNDQATSVIAAFNGPVTRILVSAGDRVHAGQPLAIVESADFSAAVAAYTKALATARTNRKLADIDRDLAQHNGIAAKEAQQAQTDAVNAEADRDSALRALAALGASAQTIATLRQGRPVAELQAVIRAPIAGTVAERLVTPGQLLQAGTTSCFTIANLSKVWVLAQIAESDLAFVKPGDTAAVVGDATPTRFHGTVTNIATQVSPDTRAVSARVVVDNPGEMLKKQMYVRVLIQSRDQTPGLLVPVSAVLRDDENLPFVFVAQPDRSFARRRVALGDRTGDRYDITSGLRAGERIVDDGAIFLQFMQAQ